MRGFIFILLTFGLGFASATLVKADDGAEMLMQLDRDFSAYRAEHGTRAAFAAFLADDVITLGPAAHPKIGLAAVLADTVDNPNVVTTWEPEGADISGDLGYTWGLFVSQYSAEDGTSSQFHGKYASFWKRQSDGSWKVVIDAFSGNPAPAN
jgi:ketosteroid isomerase-like protein